MNELVLYIAAQLAKVGPMHQGDEIAIVVPRCASTEEILEALSCFPGIELRTEQDA